MSGCKTNNKQKNSERTRSPNISHQGLLENREKILKIPRLKKKFNPRHRLLKETLWMRKKGEIFLKLRRKIISSLGIIVLLDQVFEKWPSLDPLSKKCGWMEKIEAWEKQRLPRVMAGECPRLTAMSADSYLHIHKNIIATDYCNQILITLIY